MNIANKLTILRMCLIPIFVILMMVDFNWGQVEFLGALLSLEQLVAGIIFIFACLTDYLDGYLARKYQLITAFGEFFDPMADKLLVISALLLLIQKGQVAAWVVIIIVSRELLVTGLRVLLARSNGKVLAAALPGKIKTTTQMLAIIFYLFNNAGFTYLPFSIADCFLYICLFFTVYSGLDYFYHGRFVFYDVD
ncbi:CDP-diacylglycerol--glycerol-3-phosphate 3-phosphatidyltransferase [Hutsoniella sourekii]|uniref:CDP-diacylglycerol--glycerol-3-phosphate 3-phosphatidyltransferase n=1 Tax=Hutsoniella sourekii TaxID=87650 RepID=UPI0004837ECD|nr:CDP-diacylglycerol--glycerol-3-phosphate 3-phosphatidyltransferase [Hutsoniella sourekii]